MVPIERICIIWLLTNGHIYYMLGCGKYLSHSIHEPNLKPKNKLYWNKATGDTQNNRIYCSNTSPLTIERHSMCAGVFMNQRYHCRFCDQAPSWVQPDMILPEFSLYAVRIIDFHYWHYSLIICEVVFQDHTCLTSNRLASHLNVPPLEASTFS